MLKRTILANIIIWLTNKLKTRTRLKSFSLTLNLAEHALRNAKRIRKYNKYLGDALHLVEVLNLVKALHLVGALYLVEVLHLADALHIVDALHLINTLS